MKVKFGCIVGSAAFIFLSAALVKADSPKQREAEDLFFMEIPSVITASKKLEPIDLAPNTMYVVTKEQIQERGYKCIMDVLKVIPGFGVYHKDLQFVAQVRGIAPNDNEQIAFMINGRIINQLMEPEILNGPINLDNAERIEIIVGPGTVLYGADSLAASVNLIMDEDADINEVIARAGPAEHSGTVIVSEQTAGDKKIMVSATMMNKDGYDSWRKATNASLKNLEGMDVTGQLDDSYFIFSKAQLKDWTMQFTSYNESMPELAIVNALNNPDGGKRRDSINSLVLQNSKNLTENISSIFQLTYDDKRLQRVQTEASLSAAPTAGSFDYTQYGYGLEYDLKYKDDKNYLQGGLQYDMSQNGNNYSFSMDPTVHKNAGTIGEMTKIGGTNAYGAYISEEFKLKQNLNLVGACRIDQNDVIEGNHVYVSPRAAIVYTPVEKWTSKLMYNTATKMPSIIASYLNNLWGNQNNPPVIINNALVSGHVNPLALRPEILTAFEWQNIFYKWNSRFSVNLYQQYLQDFITWYGPYTNIGNFNGSGAELEVKSKWAEPFSTWVNVSHAKADFTQKVLPQAIATKGSPISAMNPAGEMAAVPQYTANAGFDWKLLKNLTLSPEVQYFTRQPAYYIPDAQWIYVDNQLYVDMGLSWDKAFVKDLKLVLAGQNILNNQNEIGSPFRKEMNIPRPASVALTAYYKF